MSDRRRVAVWMLGILALLFGIAWQVSEARARGMCAVVARLAAQGRIPWERAVGDGGPRLPDPDEEELVAACEGAEPVPVSDDWRPAQRLRR